MLEEEKRTSTVYKASLGEEENVCERQKYSFFQNDDRKFKRLQKPCYFEDNSRRKFSH